MAEASRGSAPKLAGLFALYFAQGIPLGIAAEYLPVTLRQAGASFTLVAAVSWLQLPWSLKILWARAGDVPALRDRARGIVLGLQLGLAATIGLYVVRPLGEARALWFALTAVAALFAATQDVFVDGLAVRTLRKEERGVGNVAQVGAYRLGMVMGGAGLLTFGATLGEGRALVGLAATIALASAGVLLVTPRRTGAPPAPASAATKTTLREEAAVAWKTLRAMVRPEVRAVLVVAFTFKLGLHVAASLLKPTLVDAHWSKEQIGTLAVTVGTLAGVLGSVVGGALHRVLGDVRALVTAGALQALACVPLVLVVGHTQDVRFVTAVMALEHAASGIGTTILFAALMGATNPKSASLEFTVLSTANALSLGAGGAIGGAVADVVGKRAGFVVGAVLAFLALFALRGFRPAAAALRDEAGSAD